MSHPDSHLHLLPWYVSGRIGPKERHDVDAHLRDCADCRAEAALLTSLMNSVRSQSSMEHVAAADLVMYEEEPGSLNAARRFALEGHLTECPQCRVDFVAVRAGRRNESPPEASPKSTTGRRVAQAGWIFAAASAAVLLGVVMGPHWIGPWMQPPSTTAMVSRVVFPAPHRGAESGQALEGKGPWAISIVLPFDAKEGPYRVQVFSKDHGPSQLDITTTTDAEQRLRVFLPTLPNPGRYEMVLTPMSASVEGSFLYSFELLDQTGPKSAN
jgi:anti-sigma factor RsiW